MAFVQGFVRLVKYLKGDSGRHDAKSGLRIPVLVRLVVGDGTEERFTFLNEDGTLSSHQLRAMFRVDVDNLKLYEPQTGKTSPLKLDWDGKNTVAAFFPVEGEYAVVNLMGKPLRSHDYVACDGCGANPLIGKRYTCDYLDGCQNFDFCENCESRRATHCNGKHTFACFERPTLLKTDLYSDTLYDSLFNCLENFAPLRCVGWRDETSRAVDERVGPTANDYHWLTYREFADRALHFASGLRTLVPPRSFVGIIGPNRPEWLIADFACVAQSFVSVPIHITYTQVAVEHILNKASVELIVCSPCQRSRILATRERCPSLKAIVQWGSVTTADRHAAQQAGVDLYSFEDVEAAGSMPENRVAPVFTPEQELSTIVFTSGSTGGLPKGVRVTEKMLNLDMYYSSHNHGQPRPYIKLEHHPLAWMTGRDDFRATIMFGGSFALFSSDTMHLLRDIKAMRPTKVNSVPGVWNVLFMEYKALLQRHRANASGLFSQEEMQERAMFEFRTSQPLGDRIQRVVTGGALTPPDLMEFLRDCFFDCTVINAYGITEAGPVTTDGYSAVGTSSIIQDVPEMGYFSTDKPYPRGELLVRSSSMFAGYYNDDEATERAFTEVDGKKYFRTGDIVEHRPDGSFAIIDRKSALFKLQEGEYISPELLEGIFRQSSFVHQIFVYGDISRRCLVAIVVVSAAGARSHCPDATQDDLKQLCGDPAFRAAVLGDIRRVGAASNLPAAHIPRVIHLDTAAFSPQEGTLTPSRKPCRPRLAQRYAREIEELYTSLTGDATISIGGGTTPERLLRLVRGTLGDAHAITDDMCLADLGITSVATISFIATLRREWGVEIAPAVLLQSPLADVARYLDAGVAPSRVARPALFERDLTLLPSPDSVDAELVWASSDPAARATVDAVLLTGATGFLGSYVLCSLLAALPAARSVVCLVRAASHDAARERLFKILTALGPAWREEWTPRVMVVCGNLSAPAFGVPLHAYSALCSSVSAVVHCGARVNWSDPYVKMREANVLGTLEVLRFVRRGCPKRLHYVSTIGVAPGPREDDFFPDTPPARLSSGYNLSKWAAEHIVRKASPGGSTVLRPGMMGPHSVTGHCARHDFVPRILAGIMELGCGIDAGGAAVASAP